MKGLFAATFFSIIASGVTLVGGPGMLEERGLTLPRIIGAYYAAGVVCGLLLGVLEPFAKSTWGARVRGGLVGAVAYVSLGIVLVEPAALGPIGWIGAALIGVGMGVYGAELARRP